VCWIELDNLERTAARWYEEELWRLLIDLVESWREEELRLIRPIRPQVDLQAIFYSCCGGGGRMKKKRDECK
jgi:hypothetical protein